MQHSSELPVTEWWDPENEVYDVPGSPYNDFWQGPLTPAQAADWWAAYDHLWNLRWVMYGSAEYRPDFKGRELPSGLSQPGWLGHRDLCPIQWGDPCDCALPPRTTPCVCWYRLHTNEAPVAGAPYVKCDDFTSALFHSCWYRWSFDINPRCQHHGEAAGSWLYTSTLFGGSRVQPAPRRPACTCPGLGTHPDCRRHNTTPNEDGPQPIHDHPHNPYDLDEDERC